MIFTLAGTPQRSESCLFGRVWWKVCQCPWELRDLNWPDGDGGGVGLREVEERENLLQWWRLVWRRPGSLSSNWLWPAWKLTLCVAKRGGCNLRHTQNRGTSVWDFSLRRVLAVCGSWKDLARRIGDWCKTVRNLREWNSGEARGEKIWSQQYLVLPHDAVCQRQPKRAMKYDDFCRRNVCKSVTLRSFLKAGDSTVLRCL